MRQTLERSLDSGRYGEGTTATPLLIQFGSRLAKNLTMESLYKIKKKLGSKIQKCESCAYYQKGERRVQETSGGGQ